MTVDADLLTLLRAGVAQDVWDGHVDANEATKVISVPLPFVLYYGKRTTPENVRAGGRSERGNFPSLTCVGGTREQADAMADAVESVLDGKALGKRTVLFFERSSPARDDKYNRPGGKPLFTTALRFTV